MAHRQGFVHVSTGGTRVRIRVSSAFGPKPLLIGDAHVALHGEGPSIVPGTDRRLTFGRARAGLVARARRRRARRPPDADDPRPAARVRLPRERLTARAKK
ncbi:MAG TPA: hypothetical protein VFS43_26315 [Polyangiaceae bacterium]|nr:hypothetical protein [Polyangiaceae bacterium]